MTQLDTNALFTQYINVVNKAIHEHKDEFPYNFLLKGGEKLLGDKNIGVAVYSSDPSSPHDYFTLNMRNNGTLDVIEHGKRKGGGEPKVEWKVPEGHLRQVVDDPAPYINQPAKLDLDWLRARVRGQS